uniref:cytochrome c oxidase subunit II n=1 Tax=Pinna rudis TaxID=1380992 RepID=UPI001EDE8D6F|nr:cytochrome c oxidase subunit II [Pinna rudis]BCX41842.1 cytochrome c oxidase subunit II [Pinna rudis]
MSLWGQIGYQDALSPESCRIQWAYDLMFTTMVGILVVVLGGLFSVVMGRETYLIVVRKEWVEFLWTFVPICILANLSQPSILLLYKLCEMQSPLATVKCVGHQWYWSYEVSDGGMIVKFDQYMKPEDSLVEGEYRLLEVDKRLVLPCKVWLRMLTASEDVIHCWTVPCLGVKCDAVPGRLNEVPMSISLPGVYYGQCSEICGANHSFMPIVVEAVMPSFYDGWLSAVGEEIE